MIIPAKNIYSSIQDRCFLNKTKMFFLPFHARSYLESIPSIVDTNVLGTKQKIHSVFLFYSILPKFLFPRYRNISQVHLKNKFTDPLVSTGYLFRKDHPSDGRMKLFEKLIAEDKMRKTQECQPFVLKDIFSVQELHEYINDINQIQNGEIAVGTGNSWFYTDDEHLLYFLEDDKQSRKDIEEKVEQINTDIKENEVKKQCLNGNPEQMKLYCKVKENELIDNYDEETILQQIPQDDTKIEDVTKKFKNQSKVLNTIIILKEKKKILLGQGYIRRLCRSKGKIDHYDKETVLQMIPEKSIKIKEFVNKFENPIKVVNTLSILEKKGKITASQGSMRKVTAKTRPDPSGPLLNTWTCSMCGIKFKAQTPYRDYNNHAICENCWKKLTES